MIGDEIYTTTFVPSEDGKTGVAVFKVFSDGVATITCGEFKTIVEVKENGGEIKATELEDAVNLVLFENGQPKNGAEIATSNNSSILTFKGIAKDVLSKGLNITLRASGGVYGSIYISVIYVVLNTNGGHSNEVFIISPNGLDKATSTGNSYPNNIRFCKSIKDFYSIRVVLILMNCVLLVYNIKIKRTILLHLHLYLEKLNLSKEVEL